MQHKDHREEVQTTAPPRQPFLTRRFQLFMLAMILANTAVAMYGFQLPLYLQELGADVGQVGLFFTLGSIAPLAFQIFGGWISDATGSLQTIAIGSTTGLLSYLIYVFAQSWEWLLIATVTGAIAQSFVGPSYLAFIAEESGKDRLGRAYGFASSLLMIVGVIGPPLGGFLSQKYGFRVMFMVAGGLYSLATIIRLSMARNAKLTGKEKKKKITLLDFKASMTAMMGLLTAGGVVTWFMITDGMSDVSAMLAHQLRPIYMQNILGLDTLQIGWLSSIYAVTSMLFITPAGWLSDKKGERVGIVGGSALMAAAMILFLQAHVFMALVPIWILYGIANALFDPAYKSLISKAVPRKLRGTAFGLFSTSIGIVSLPFPWIGALLWERYTPQTPFYLSIVTTLVLLPVMWCKFRLSPAKRTTDQD